MSSDDGSTAVPSLDSLKANVTAMQEADGKAGYPRRELGVTWKDVSVEVPSAEAALHENVLSQWNIPQLIKEARRKPPIRTILDKSHGCVKPGEMLLVLGRPGSGCTTLLNILANKRNGYANVSGDVHYGSMEAKDAAQYRGQIVMNTEEELFFPSLTVGQTMDFATRLKLPFKLPGSGSKEEYRKHTRDFLLESVGIEHTLDTKVGDAFLRGVSGGERKRVSIVECLATKGSIFCWDNSTRGLDASTALEYTKVIRALTDVLGTASIVSLYQAGNGIFELFDKVLILDEGKQIYYGPMKAARPFMEDLGFICPDGANVADYLTGVTIPTERKVRREMRLKFPKTGAAIRDEYEQSDIYKSAITEYDFPSTDDARSKTEDFKTAVSMEKHKSLAKDSPYTVSFTEQVAICVKRQYQIIWGDKVTFFMKQIFTIIQGLIAGSLLYNAPPDSSGLFIKSGALFFSLLYNTLVAMSEVTNSFAGRPVLIKHKSFGFFHPAAFCIAEVAADIPVIFAQVSLLSLIVYFMVNLTASAGAFFTFWVVVFSATICMTAMFRAIGAVFPNFDSAIKVAGLFISAIFMYMGYMIQKPHMHPWFVWIFWIDPLAYAFDSLLSNEFAGKIVPCVGTNLIPNGPGFTDKAYQSCGGVPGATGNKTYVTGEEYLSALSYGKSHIWRNFGVVWAWWVLFLVITIWATSRWKAVSEQGPSLLIPREKKHLTLTNKQSDEEGQMRSKEAESSSGTTTPARITEPTKEVALEEQLERNTSIFTWKNLNYTVKTPQGDRRLLDNVQGWVEPGKLVALMGSSGAGKTTLLDVLAQRKTEGTIEGSILVDGRPLSMSFQRSAGYCEQLDVHESYATVREALEFSALLRQNRNTPREAKLAYVETIIDLLELHDIADTLIGEVGAGLSVEQRKRVTIGVELVSKPSILIFLDEPTSGLDGQSAFRTVSFLRKLAAVGQAVMVTIHQPSAQLFYQFDNLLLLAKGGKTVYFGEIGEEAATVKDYFARHGVPCPTEVNPAEHMIDVVSGQHSKSRDWSEVWLSTPEYEKTTQRLDELIRTAASQPSRTVDDGFEFAMPLWDQVKIVTHRMNVSLYRNTDYANNKFALHIFSALFNGFSFWMVGDSVSELQLKLFTIYNFIFVAPGVLQQLQPLFIHRRDIFETREKKSKMYSWIAFVTALIVSEIPYLIVCAVLYFICWYYTVGFPAASTRAGATFFVVLMYEFLYTGIGQFVAAYAPNAMAANLINPLLIGTMVSFCGVLVPYAQIQPFWRYWMYYINPFNYLMGSMLVFNIWGAEVHCKEAELATFNPPSNMTCGEYLTSYKESPYGMMSNLLNPEAMESCKVCSFSAGEDYLRTLNLNEYYYGWRDAGIVALMVFSSYTLVYLLMKLRTKMTKTAQ